jgi:hypothetical protein
LTFHPAPFLVVFAAFGGCIIGTGPEDRAVMCESTADCTGTKICDLGVCWGDPPDTSLFAAVLIPPAGRPELAPTELTSIRIAPDGRIAGLEFSKTVQLRGRVTIACGEGEEEGCGDRALVPAQIIVERAASFLGGPQYRRTVLTNVGASEGGDSFSISLPADAAEYRVTVVPDENMLDALAIGSSQVQAPPFSTLIRTTEDLAVHWEIGKPEQLKTIKGCITSATGNGSNFQGMHVSARGRWTALSSPTRASSVVTTDAEGCYSLKVPIDMLDEFDIIAKPGPGKTLPTLRLFGEHVVDPSVEEPLSVHLVAPLLMPNAPNPVIFKLPLLGQSGSGSSVPVSGATVEFRTVFELPVPDDRNIEVSFSSQAVSNSLVDDEPGFASLEIYPGSADLNRLYQVKVFSPPDSEFASVFDGSIEVGTGEGAPVLNHMELKRRVAVTGTFLTATSDPLASTPITVRPSPQLRLAVSPLDRTILDNLQFPSDLTKDTGEFLLWLDPELLGQAARYDLELAPPDFSSAPRWVVEDLTLQTSGSDARINSTELGSMSLPAASYARGDVRDSDGHLVIGAEVRWFQIPTAEACAAAGTGDCQARARALGNWESDDSGEVVAVLPDP